MDLPPQHRHIGYVAQDVALFPHMSVRQNVLYGRRDGQRLSLDTVARMLEIAPLLERRRAAAVGRRTPARRRSRAR